MFFAWNWKKKIYKSNILFTKISNWLTHIHPLRTNAKIFRRSEKKIPWKSCFTYHLRFPKISYAILIYIKKTSFKNFLSYIWQVNILHKTKMNMSSSTEIYAITNTRKAKAASGRLSFKWGYNQRCQWYQNLPLDIPKLHAKFHQNPWCGFGEKCGQDNDIVQF